MLNQERSKIETKKKMKKLITLLFAIAFLFQSCGNDRLERAKEEAQQTTKVAEKDSIDFGTSVKNRDTLKIKYLEHKNLLNILTKLPTHTMESWKWSEGERIKFVKFIQENDFAFSSSPHFSKFSLIGANTIGIQVVDGYWTLAIYKIKTNNYIVITDDRVGDGNDLHAFEYKDGKLHEINFENLFDKSFFYNLMIYDEGEVEDVLEETMPWFDYDFTSTTNLIISNPHNLKEDELKNSLKGNTMNYKFNPLEKKFDLIAISWEKSEK